MPGSEDGAGSKDEVGNEEEAGAESDSSPLSDLRDEVAGRGDDSTDSRDEANEPSSTPTTDAESGEADRIPLSDLRNDVEKRQEEAETDTGMDPFHEEQVPDLETEAIWADLLMTEGDAAGEVDPTATGADDRGPYQIVTKTLCHRCRHFGEPPELHCTHDGTTIHEVVDMDHYRVSKCPMVAHDGRFDSRDS